MRIAFLGTPEFAVPSLRMLIAEGHELAVFTQPDRPKGRGNALTMPEVKREALAAGLPVFQFEKIRSDEGEAALRSFAPELMVTAAFGQLLSKENLASSKYGCINVHGSLLPKYRGASPIQSAIINGEAVTGVTTMLTDIGMDTGDILLSQSTPIGENETYGELYSRLSVLGAELLKTTIERLSAGTLQGTPQNEAEASYSRMIKKQDTQIDFSLTSRRIHDLVRGLCPQPSAFAVLGGEQVKVFAARQLAQDSPLRSDALRYISEKQGAVRAGECVAASPKRGLAVKTGDGLIELVELQFPNSKRMSASAALNSRRLLGETFAPCTAGEA